MSDELYESIYSEVGKMLSSDIPVIRIEKNRYKARGRWFASILLGTEDFATFGSKQTVFALAASRTVSENWPSIRVAKDLSMFMTKAINEDTNQTFLVLDLDRRETNNE